MGWVINATTRSFYPRERLGTHCIGGWASLRAALDSCGKPRPHRDPIPERASHTAYAIPALSGTWT